MKYKVIFEAPCIIIVCSVLRYNIYFKAILKKHNLKSILDNKFL